MDAAKAALKTAEDSFEAFLIAKKQDFDNYKARVKARVGVYQADLAVIKKDREEAAAKIKTLQEQIKKFEAEKDHFGVMECKMELDELEELTDEDWDNKELALKAAKGK